MNADRLQTFQKTNSRLSVRKSEPSAPAWFDEQANVLHRIFTRIELRVKSGGKVRPLVYRAAKRWAGKSLKSDPAKKYSRSLPNWKRLFYKWKLGGAVPSALRVDYKPNHSRLPAPVAHRFIRFCASTRWPSYKGAWLAFCARKGSFGRGARHKRRGAAFTLRQFMTRFPVARFRAVQKEIKLRDAAEANRTLLEFSAIAAVVDPPKRRRGLNYEI